MAKPGTKTARYPGKQLHRRCLLIIKVFFYLSSLFGSSMSNMKAQFIELALQNNVLQWGKFVLKSGRVSPYFFNAGLFYQGQALRAVGQCYAEVLTSHEVSCEHLFGPAYKGIALASATGIALAEKGINVTLTFNRKEVKDHGEGGQLIGAPLVGKTVIVDDVITAGTAFREARAIIQEHGGELSTVVIALDRAERGQDDRSAVESIREQGIEVLSIISVFDLMDYLEEHNEHEQAAKLRRYQEVYGV